MRDQPLETAVAGPGDRSTGPVAIWRRVLRAHARLAGALAWLLLAFYLAGALLILATRHVLLPRADAYRDDIAGMLSDAVGLRVTIGHIDAQWYGLNPGLALRGVQIHDEQGRPALRLEEVDTELSWTTLVFGQLRLRRLEFAGPNLSVRREPGGRIYVAGIAVRTDGPGTAFSEWVLAQPSILIRDATISWSDAQRRAPELTLARVDVRLENRGLRHRIGVHASPPTALAGRIDLRADLRGAATDPPAQWAGQLYAQVDSADLAAWRQWFDYPVEVIHGNGALRMWLEGGAGARDAVTADLDVRALQVRLAPQQPVLELDALGGRLGLRRLRDAVQFTGRNVVLATGGGAPGEPADFSVRWTGENGGGDLTASRIDLESAGRLAAHLPVEESLRTRLAAAAPRGRLAQIQAAWQGPPAHPARYRLDARFEHLGVSADGAIPGFSGLSGRLRGSEQGGSLELAGDRVTLDIPGVFPGMPVRLDTLSAEATWSVRDAQTEIVIRKATFANADAAGSLSGRYRTLPAGPGEIDLEAHLSRAQAGAAWRYLPATLGASTREWLKAALRGGHASEAKLLLKGDLSRFPFAKNHAGTFRVTGKFTGGSLRYAPDWPELSALDGDLLFEGARMLIRSQRGKVLGAALGPVSAEIPDLAAETPLLQVRGNASGRSAEFLRFIEASPVAAMIGHYTDGVKATGTGSLQLGLSIPLGNLGETRVEGEYRFVANDVTLDPSLPPLIEATGQARFTGSGITSAEVDAKLFDSPIRLKAASGKDGALRAEMRGSASVSAWRSRLDWPVLDHLGGTTAWQAVIAVRRKTAAVTLESDLVGISSSLPDPFNKSASEPLAVRLDRTTGEDGTAEEGRERLRVSLGRQVGALVERRSAGGQASVERAGIGIGVPPVLPDRGVGLTGRLARLNVDAWRRAFPARDGRESGLALRSLQLQVGELTAFGQSLHDLDLRASRSAEGWQAAIGSRELTGDLDWSAQGSGRLRARLKHLALAELKPDPGARAEPEEEQVKSLPTIDLAAEDFSLRGKPLGRIELLAANRAGLWKIDRLSIANPDASLVAEGGWRPGAASAATEMRFKLKAADAGKLLARFGYPDGLRAGKANMDGTVTWNGPPTSIDFPSLEGKFKLDAEKGQFRKLDPGVGRLLGILSLQTLPRRITLDFRDVFSEGFAFDTISGSIEARRGVLDTRDLAIHGPAASIAMTGTVDLVKETQDLRVRVQPSLSESLSVGAALVNPVAGLAALVAQKVLRDPLEKIFSYEYAVRGSWEDPKVEKLSAAKPAQSGK